MWDRRLTIRGVVGSQAPAKVVIGGYTVPRWANGLLIWKTSAQESGKGREVRRFLIFIASVLLGTAQPLLFPAESQGVTSAREQFRCVPIDKLNLSRVEVIVSQTNDGRAAARYSYVNPIVDSCVETMIDGAAGPIVQWS
jgi:hypothetical protein